MRIVSLPGDGIGPEVTAAAVRVLEALPLEVSVEEHPFGGAAIHATGNPLPEETLEACRAADAILLGAVGLPEFDGAAGAARAGAHPPARRARRLRQPAARRAGRASTC